MHNIRKTFKNPLGVELPLVFILVTAGALLGGCKHREQHYNLQGANSYPPVIITLAVLTMVLPDYTQSTPGPSFLQWKGCLQG